MFYQYHTRWSRFWQRITGCCDRHPFEKTYAVSSTMAKCSVCGWMFDVDEVHMLTTYVEWLRLEKQKKEHGAQSSSEMSNS